MSTDLKGYLYVSGQNLEADTEFKNAERFGNVKLSAERIYWRRGFRWYMADFNQVDRVYRRVEEAKAKICCGNANFDVEKLMLVLKSGEILEARIGDGTRKEAEALFAAVKTVHPELKFGKEK